jgi:chromosome segregation ATPase
MKPTPPSELTNKIEERPEKSQGSKQIINKNKDYDQEACNKVKVEINHREKELKRYRNEISRYKNSVERIKGNIARMRVGIPADEKEAILDGMFDFLGTAGGKRGKAASMGYDIYRLYESEQLIEAAERRIDYFRGEISRARKALNDHQNALATLYERQSQVCFTLDNPRELYETPDRP